MQNWKAHAAEVLEKELGLEIAQDGIVSSNLLLCYNNACIRKPEQWELFLAHICWPEDNEFPESLFLVPKSQVPGYTRLMKRLELLYG